MPDGAAEHRYDAYVLYSVLSSEGGNGQRLGKRAGEVSRMRLWARPSPIATQGEVPQMYLALWIAAWAKALVASTVPTAANVCMSMVNCIVSLRAALGFVGHSEPTRRT